MSRKKNETDEEYHKRRQEEYKRYYKRKEEHEIQTGLELLGKPIRVSDYTKEKILSGKTQVLVLNGKLVQFRKKTDNGYWFNNHDNILYLHREVYKQEMGLTEEQIAGYEVHHIDGNKDNNSISNLKLLTPEEHHKLHGDSRGWTEEQWKRARERMNHAREYANEWHRSEEGRAWHRKQYEVSLGKAEYKNEKTKKICEQCGAEYEVRVSNAKSSRFCSNKCKSAWRRASHVDDEVRICEVCGKNFITNKYNTGRTCSSRCANKS